MTDRVLLGLLNKCKAVEKQLSEQVLQAAAQGDASQALRVLENSPLTQQDRADRTFGAIEVYLLHQAARYPEANRVLDRLIGLDLSTQLVMDNCPSEADIVCGWDPDAEGVSILCTSFNHARFIDMALAGFISQISTHPFEVIVRDDASTDGTQDILKTWAARYPRLLRVVQLPHNTFSAGIAPMPAALEHARYPLIALCEGDDFWVDNQKLQIQADMLKQHPTWSAVSHNHFELNEGIGRLLPGRQNKVRGFLARSDLLNVHLVLWVHTLMIRKDKLNLPAYSHRDGILGDQVMTACLGLGGEVYFRGDLMGSVARRNLSSTYTPLLETDKQKKRIQTRRFLASVMADRGERPTADRLLRWCEQAQRQQDMAVA
jgi:hypothetical protein